MGKNPEKQFWLWVLLLCVGILLLVGLQATLFLGNHVVELSALSRKSRIGLLVFLILAQVSLLPFLIWGMRAWYHRYVLPMHRIREDVEALVHGSPNARLAAHHRDPADLASILNVLMERYQHSEEAVQQRLGQALSGLSSEKSHLESLLAAVMEGVVEGVVAVNREGGIMRYNRAASSIFGDRPELGIGKPMSGLVESPVLEFCREMLEQQVSTGTPHPFVPFHCAATGREAGLPARISPLVDREGVIDGYLLTVEPEDAPALNSTDISTGESTTRGWETGAGKGEGDGEGEGDTASTTDLDAPLSKLRYVVFDTETTGLNPAAGDEIISIGAVAVMNGAVLPGESFDRLIKPSKPVTRAAWKVHGIGDADLFDADPPAEVLRSFFRFVGNSVLVAHNAAFDMAFLRKATAGAASSDNSAAGNPDGGNPAAVNPTAMEGKTHRNPGFPTLHHPVLDTMLLSAVLHPNQPSHSLDSLLARYGISVSGRHSALGDAAMTAELLLRLLPQLESRGIHTQREALKASRRSPLARLSYD